MWATPPTVLSIKRKVYILEKKCCKRTHVDFHLSGLNIEICENYKYLGVILNEFFYFTETANVLCTLQGEVTNFYNKTDLMFSSYTKIYDSKLAPTCIMDYCSSVWGGGGGGLNFIPNQILIIIELYVPFLEFINVLQMQ